MEEPRLRAVGAIASLAVAGALASCLVSAPPSVQRTATRAFAEEDGGNGDTCESEDPWDCVGDDALTCDTPTDTNDDACTCIEESAPPFDDSDSESDELASQIDSAKCDECLSATTTNGDDKVKVFVVTKALLDDETADKAKQKVKDALDKADAGVKKAAEKAGMTATLVLTKPDPPKTFKIGDKWFAYQARKYKLEKPKKQCEY
jgi:hypothetical protein